MFCPACAKKIPGELSGVEYVCAFCRCTFTLTMIDKEYRVRQIIGDFRAGRRIAAIKKMRELTGCGLKVAKVLVEAMEALDGGRV